MYMDKRWRLLETNPDTIAQLSSSLNIHKSFCTLLALRGVDSYTSAEKFFRPTLLHLHDPYLMKDMDKAVARIVQAIEANEKIMIYGDYDVDGTTSVAVVCHFLKQYCDNIIRYVPNRFSEGYGISAVGMQKAIDENVKLFIALDCGIKSHVHIDTANAAGIDCIICDHHLPEETVPQALAILNPKQVDCDYPFKELCGCGIGFKLISAIEDRLHNTQEKCLEYLDLVATAIAADIVPIVDENRTLAYFGLQKANQNPCVAISALKQVADLQRPFTITDLVFVVAPRVNAAGRMDDAAKAVDLFMSNDRSEAAEFAKMLNIDNEDRKDVDKQITSEASAMLMALPHDKRSTVLYNKQWHKGVVGIVASRLIEQKFQPTIVLTESNGKLTGSARSIPGFNLFDGLTQCSEYLTTFGGHYFAAGLTLDEKNFEPFATRFDEVVKATLTEEQFLPEIQIDAVLELRDINDKYYNILTQFAPHGPQNMRPIFCSNTVRNYQGECRIVKEKHVKFIIEQDGAIIKGIGFNLAEKFAVTQAGSFDICYHIEPNEWNGVTNIEIRVLDIKPASK
ncbi:MAG: single-stranded-DNA-specific exonuclease RecJ [Bacteroidota bacterium]